MGILSVFFRGYSGDTVFHNSSCFYCFSISRFSSDGRLFSISRPCAASWVINFDWLIHYFWLHRSWLRNSHRTWFQWQDILSKTASICNISSSVMCSLEELKFWRSPVVLKLIKEQFLIYIFLRHNNLTLACWVFMKPLANQMVYNIQLAMQALQVLH